MGTDHDVVVVGAGFSGLYAVHKLRDELGLAVQGFEAGDGPGGTWYWNRYPGARCDFESVHYSYSFSDELQREWEWSEKFPSQPEILAYLEWAADKLDVRRAFRFCTRVTSLDWDDASARWTVATDDGESHTARFVVSCVGNLSVPKETDFPGSETFQGELYRTSSWPHEGVDFTGKRVAVVGTGSTGIQAIPEIARQAAHVTVFQRTAAFAAPLRNAPVDPAQRRWNAEHHAELRAGSRESFIGVPYEKSTLPAMAVSAEERRRTYDKAWEEGGFRLLTSTFTDLLFNQDANDTVADYIRDRIRERVEDPATAELLCPSGYPYIGKRPPFETDYYDAFNLEHVELVDLRPAPIHSITPTGISTSDASYEFDAIVLATGFDAVTGPLLKLGITGREGLALEQKWAEGPTTYLGIHTAGFPNLFMICGPQSAAALYNNPLAIEDHIEFTAAAIARVQASGASTFEATPEAEHAWVELTYGLLNMTVIPRAQTSWYMGANIAGKPRAAYLFASGVPFYRAVFDEVQLGGFTGFAVDGRPSPTPPLAKLDCAVALTVASMMLQGVKPLEQCTLEETRALVESFTQMQAPGPDVGVSVLEEPRARVYTPAPGNGASSRPVVLFFHPGGWIAGSLDVADNPCRRLAAELDAIVVSAGYPLAPEHPFPAATDATFAAVQWAREHIAEYGGDPDRIAVMGESAGANLAAVAAVRARDAGIELAAQVLLYPPIDPNASTPSRAEFADGPFLSVAAADAMWAAYLAGAEVTPLAAPSRNDDLSGLAPALVLTLECDPTRDEAEDYARVLGEAGVAVEHHRLDGLIHGVFNMSAIVPRVDEIHTIINRFLTETFARAAAPA